MKTTNATMSERPRLTCRVVQGWASLTGDGPAPRPGTWAARHAAGCAGCRQFMDTGRELDTALRQSAPGRRVPASPGLERDIMAAIARAQREAAPRRSPTGWGVGAWALAGAAATVAVGALVLRSTRAPGEGRAPGTVAANVSAEPADEPIAGLAGFWQPDASALLGGEPLQREADAVYSSARSALGFLALNFLPPQALEAGTGGTPAEPVRRPASG